MKTFFMFFAIIWFVFGASAADDRGFFDGTYTRTCTHVGTAALTVVAGPLYYAGLKPAAYC
ncbi:MAG: hypothetical protein QOH37_2769 [Nocardioidaceae bacterium]|jgi:hypothetical protein|nr:hypothetical protein [Nocardioidaceae bacterium]